MTDSLHLCIVSGQSLPNLLPLCQHRPQRVALAVSGDMQQRIPGMIDTLCKAGLIERAQDVISLPNMPDHDYDAMLAWSRQHVGLLLQALPDHHLTLNATGGTKLMSQALAVACQEHPERTSVLYCDTAHDSIEWLFPRPRLEALPGDLLDSATLLKANGISRDAALSDAADWREQVQNRAPMTRWLASQAAGSLGSFIPELNHALFEVDPEQLPQTVRLRRPASSPAWREALRRLAAQGLLELPEPLLPSVPPAIAVHDPDALRYLTGIWLEEYVWLCMHEAGLLDAHCSVQISDDLGSRDESKLNELDLVAGHRNRILVVECKTADLVRPGAYNRMLDKLDSLGKRAGGLLTQCWLVAARWPHHSEAQRNRLRLLARARNITLVEPRHLADLPARIRDWKNTLRLPLD